MRAVFFVIVVVFAQRRELEVAADLRIEPERRARAARATSTPTSIELPTQVERRADRRGAAQVERHFVEREAAVGRRNNIDAAALAGERYVAAARRGPASSSSSSSRAESPASRHRWPLSPPRLISECRRRRCYRVARGRDRSVAGSAFFLRSAALRRACALATSSGERMRLDSASRSTSSSSRPSKLPGRAGQVEAEIIVATDAEQIGSSASRTSLAGPAPLSIGERSRSASRSSSALPMIVLGDRRPWRRVRLR